MVLRVVSFILVSVLFLGLPDTASAKTIKFASLADLIDPWEPQIYEEKGFSVTPTDGGDFGSFGSGGLHIDICCGPYTSGATIQHTSGGLFSLKSLKLNLYPATKALNPLDTFVYFHGFRDNSLVATVFGGSGFHGKIKFKKLFSYIDSFVIGTIIPEGFDFATDLHFDVDNIKVKAVKDKGILAAASESPDAIAPVPLAPGHWFLLTGIAILAGLTYLGRKRQPHLARA